MKTFLNLAFLAALGAFAFSLINVETAGSLLFATGLANIMMADYSRRSRMLRVRSARSGAAPVLATCSPATSAFGLAA